MIDKFQASMLGYAIGDALAAPLEDVVRNPEFEEEIVKEYTKGLTMGNFLPIVKRRQNCSCGI